MPAPFGLPGLFRDVALSRPDRIACEDSDRRLTFRQLDARSDVLADRVLAATDGRSGAVALVMPRGVDLLVALVGILKARCWYVPLGVEEPARRVAEMVTAAQPLAVLTDDRELVAPLASRPRIAVPADDHGAAGPRALPPVGADHPVYVMFTSGSSGTPKGVLQGSDALCNRLVWMARHYGVGPDDAVLQKTPYTFDVSGWELYLPLITGARCVLAPEGDHRDPAALARFVRGRHVTICHFVPSMLDEVLRYAPELLDAPLRDIVCSGESLSAGTVARVRARTGARLHNLYGPTEAAIDVTHWTVPTAWTPDRPILIGTPIDNTDLYVLDERTGRPADSGELWIGGMPVALGYVGATDLTASAFRTIGAERCYRTGDLVRVVPGAGLEYLGRRDGQVKVRGVRVEPGEVEHALERHEAIERAVVVAVPAKNGPRLAAALIGAARVPRPGDADLRDHLRTRLPPAFVPAQFLWVDSLPLGATGKVDRRAIQETLVRDHHRPPCDDEVDELAAGWWRLLRADAAERDEDTGFVSLGGHSLSAVRLAAWLRGHAGVEVTLADLLRDNLSLAGLRRLVARTLPDAARAAPVTDTAPVADTAVSRLTPGQRRLWLLTRTHPDAVRYNVVTALLLTGPISVTALRMSLDDVVARHDSLRARVVEDDTGHPFLRHDAGVEVPFTVERTDAPLSESVVHAHVRSSAAVPIPLDDAPLLRAGLLTTTDDTDGCLVLSLHHLVADQRSVDIVLADLATAYAARSAGRAPHLPPAPRFAGFAARTAGENRGTADDVGYWRTVLDGTPPELALPFCREADPVPSLRGGSVRRDLGAQRTASVDAYARRTAVTPAAVFMSVVATVLCAWSAQPCVVIGIPSSARRRACDDDLVGFLVDTLPIRIDTCAQQDFPSLVRHVRDRYLAAVAHSGLPFQEIVAACDRPSRPHRNPLFQVWFNDLSNAAPPPTIPGISVSGVSPPGDTALFDLNFYLTAHDGRLRLELVHASDRVPADVAVALLGHCVDLLDRILDGRPVTPASPVLPPAGPPGPGAPLPVAPAVPSDRLVARVLGFGATAPDAIAIEAADRSWTYGQLAAEIGTVAQRLTAESVVEIRAERSAYLPIVLLAAWRAGGVPAPVDAALPPARLDALRTTLRPRHVVHATASGPRWSEDHSDGRSVTGASHILFTSGTSGRPSAVVVPHGPLTGALDWYVTRFRPSAADRVMLLGGLGHDPVLRDILVPLCSGGTLVVPPAGSLTTPRRLLECVARHRITLVHATPALLELLVAGAAERPDLRLPTVRAIVAAGAPLTVGLVRRLRDLTPAEIVNGYGTTETPQIAAAHQVLAPGRTARPLDRLRAETTLPVGVGVPGVEMVVEAVPGRRAGVGQVGEVVVRSARLATGYLDATDTGGFGSDPCGRPGVRAYRTGDLGRTDPSGLLHLAGRRDRQVLVDGFRVALEEVEATALAHPAVRQATARLRETPAGAVIALWVAVSSADGPKPATLRRHLRSLLPSYAVPAIVTIGHRLHVDANHKVVADTGTDARRAHPSRVATASPALEHLARLMREVLGTDIGPDDNFFEAGLTSIGLLNLHARLGESFRSGLPVTELFTHPNLRSLAGLLDAREEGAEPSPPGRRPSAPRSRTADERRQVRRWIESQREKR
ncbi:hypothetical protein Voc01_076170 [Virgisporangium ochraceum]|uniref:Carrier domain-containing protein n=2 Tax=Virgisporangium ochraceum TaxID=65505 RepID=A0A8J4EEL6_9ACTN|nr:hypothetical protein Voc01_076170 [Virgisporangium ochraceum]